MSKFTSGPWEVSNMAIWASSPWNARVCIADVNSFSPTNGIDSAANATLIAAAPDLLAALEEAKYMFAGEYPGHPTTERIFTAIAKATGNKP